MNRQLKSVILLAGQATRMRPASYKVPKTLLTVDGKPLLWYSITNLLSVGVKKFCLVVGYKSVQIEHFVQSYFPNLDVTYTHNNLYKTSNSIYSYYLSIPFFLNSNYFRLEGDLLYSRDILKSLLSSNKSPVSAVEKKPKSSAEDYSVRIGRHQDILCFGKQIPAQEAFGEAKGIEFVSSSSSRIVAKSLTQLIKNNSINEYAEIAYQNIINNRKNMYYTQLNPADFWCEVDTHNDLIYARRNLKKIYEHI